VDREPFIKLLYVTPERLVKAEQTKKVLEDLYNNDMLARFIIDEAHCVSSWGHDFRKDYASLNMLKDKFIDVPIVALTATARKKVADDTIKILNIPNCKRFNTGKLSFIVLH
jgi:bloom syndrome protein